uniref:Signal-induced proliferation-associated 1-like protein 2 n=1 Tax=Lygus hesperus TaxID=30085 RepID=A0A0A9ZCU3_LYGHE
MDEGSPNLENGCLRRRGFAHYDCRSIGANLGYAARLRSLLSRRRNTTTGASAASTLAARSTTPDSITEEDPGDGLTNDLLESCPFFRNEIGGEEERMVGLMRGKRKTQRGPLHRPVLACGVSVLEFPPGETHWVEPACPYNTTNRPIEVIDQGALYYRKYFYQQEHQNWFGMDDNLGPVAVSVRKEKVEKTPNATSHIYRYRLLVRTSELLTLRGSVMEDAIPNLKPSSSTKTVNTKEVIEYCAPEVQISCLRLGTSGQQTEDSLLKLDEQGLSKLYKVGVMYCKAGQSTEEQMYNNHDAGPAFDEFLDSIGERVRLKGFDKYKAGLDNRTDSTGLYSVYAQYQDCEIMFHVSTLLPFTPNNRQQLLRKRHIGNDIVTIVFQEPGAQPFTPKVIRSQFQHVFIIVKAVNPCSDNTHYRVSVTRSKEVPAFGPPIPEGALFPKSKAFAEFLLAKVINAENAAHQSEKFVTMATRTRQEYLKDLVANYTTMTAIETNQKFSMLSFSSKKKERWRPRFLPDEAQCGAVCWQVVLDDCSQSTLVECFLAISSDSLVLIEETTREIIFVTPCKSILGWSTNTNSLRLYYHQGECVTVHMREGGDRDELMEVVVRLRAVTSASVAQELSLKRNPLGQLGFHVQPDGVVTQVEPNGLAWTAGLRQGARLVEICKVAVSTLTHDQMVDLLKTSVAVTVAVIPPLSEGVPRRGCTLQNCKYNTILEGDFENNNNGSQLTKGVRQQAVTSSVRKRSSNSSGYGTGSSCKSSASTDRFNNNEGTLSSSLSTEERWYDVSECGLGGDSGSTPPPLPIRHTSYDQPNSPKINGYSLHESPQHDYQVGEKVTCVVKSAKETMRPINRSQDVYVTQDYTGQSADSERGSEGSNSRPLSDGHSDISSSSDRIFSALSEGDLSANGSPSTRRAQKNSDIESSPRSKDSVSSRLRAGVSSRSQRSSANLQTSTLQQDLLKLIHPDYIPQDNGVSSTQQYKNNNLLYGKISSGSLPEVGSISRSRENLSTLSLRSHSPPTKEKETIVMMARPATVISNASTASSPALGEKLSKDDRLSPRAVKGPVNQTKALLLPDAQEMDWPSLVDTATRAMRSVEADAANSGEPLKREEELSNHISQLETRLTRETRRRLSLEEEVRGLREENRRLLHESQSAAQQLRRFTEWFFQTIDKQ